MKVEDMKAYMKTIKDHVDHLNYFSRQVTNMIYEIEEKLMDIEDGICEFKENSLSARLNFLEVAATRMYSLSDSPPRLKTSRCSKDHIAADGFYQSDFDLKKII